MPQLVDRREEFELLWRRWGQARNGSGQVVLLTGEAGIGKSRLATELVERTRSESHAGLYYFGLPHQTDASLFALIGELQKAAGFEGGDTSAARRAKLEVLLAQSGSCPTDAMMLLADVLSLPSDGRCGVAQLTPHQRKERTFAALMARIEGMAARQPVLAVVEDIQWVDPTSLEFLALLVEKVPRLPVLMLIAARPEFRPPWPGYAHVTMIALPRLGRDDAEALVGHAAGGKSLPEAVTTQILARTDGLPLFLEELTKTVLESGLLQERAGQYELRGPNPTPNIPKSLHGSLLERLDRLGPARDVAQIAAVIGREFPYELLRMVVATPESGLGAALDRIVASELVFGRGVPPLATYVFKHALVRETAYGMLPRVRRRQLHGAIARALEERFPDVVETQPELLGHHHAEAGSVSRAVAYLVTAGERSLLRSAITEALAHLTKALALLSAQPQDDARRRQELTVQVALSRAWVAKMGHTAPETFRALDRARELCELLGDQAHLPVVIYGQWQAAWGAGAHVAALGHAQAMLKWGERVNDPAGKTFGHFLLGVSSMLMGALSTARRHLETALALDCFESSPFGDLVTWRAGVIRPSGRFALCDCLFLLGWPAQAETVAGRAMIETDNISHNYARALALSRVCRMHALRRDARSLSATAAELLELSSEEGYPHFAANSMLFRGWALTLIGETVQGLELARSGIARCRAIGFLVWQSQLLAMLAECHAKSGDLESGLRALAEAMEVAEEKGERFYEPELHRLRGELYRDAGRDRREVEDCFVRALDAARRHEARLLELRAATSLARLMASQGRQDDARDALAPIYNWFTEGLDTDDLQSAKVVLDSLR